MEVLLGLFLVAGLAALCFILDQMFNERCKFEYSWKGFLCWLVDFIIQSKKNDKTNDETKTDTTSEK